MTKTAITLRVEKEVKDEFYKLAEQNAQMPTVLIRNFMKDYIKNNKGEIEMEFVKNIMEIKLDNSGTTAPDNEVALINEVKTDDGDTKYEVVIEVDGLGDVYEGEYFDDLEDAIKHVEAMPNASDD